MLPSIFSCIALIECFCRARSWAMTRMELTTGISQRYCPGSWGKQMQLRKAVRAVTPPILWQALRRRDPRLLAEHGESRLSGNFQSWDEAKAASIGYDADVILEKSKLALLKVKRGEAVYERDSVLFAEVHYAWPLLAGLMWAAARNDGSLNVLDFGGSLGSTYFQNRSFFAGLRAVRWNIVEQARQVQTGKGWFEDDQLKFYSTIEECLANTQPQVILLGSVLQYLEHPYDTLAELTKSHVDLLIVDRTPFWRGGTDRLCVQHVSADIYPASYPSWILSTQRFYSWLHEQWRIIAEFDNPDRIQGPVEFAYRGILAARRKPTNVG